MKGPDHHYPAPLRHEQLGDGGRCGGGPRHGLTHVAQLKDDARRGGIKPSNPYVRAGAPRLVVDITEYGYQYTGIPRLGDAEMHARTYHYILPFHQIRAASNEIGD